MKIKELHPGKRVKLKSLPYKAEHITREMTQFQGKDVTIARIMGEHIFLKETGGAAGWFWLIDDFVTVGEWDE